MKLKVLFALMALLASESLVAKTITVPAQGVSPFLDTEVSTNVVLHTGRNDLRNLDINIQFAGTATNVIEVALGRDVNTNGVLDVAEIDVIYGWRMGRCFIENVRERNRMAADAPESASCATVNFHLETTREIVPSRFSAFYDSASIFPELATEPPAWLYRREWNLMRVTRRGTEPLGTRLRSARLLPYGSQPRFAAVTTDWIRCDIGYSFFNIRIR